ncbi:MAG: protoheme IX farnesyltransferase [Lewinellaceae bacterium]|nr:heme o synthase [Saprospiraceae bacterium]MCB9343906.1 protoheme IX farnesyltransferase [Lewinellaceae bacterium]
MQRNEAKRISVFSGVAQAISDFGLLVKFKLTLLVLFSAIMSYAIVAVGNVSLSAILLLTFGGFFITGAANALNQVLERDYDRLMVRTSNRPVASGRISVPKAVLLAGLMAIVGITLLTMLNMTAGFLGTLSFITYAFIYTPLKRTTALSVAIGAIPGALPLIIGCVAFEQVVSPMAMYLFALQFFWQFPHFWAVAWVADEDYKRAGFYLLPSRNGEKDQVTGMLSFIFCLLLILNTGIGYWLGLIGGVASVALTLLNLWWAFKCWDLYKTCSQKSARAQMFLSFAHLPLSLIVLLLDKI